MHTQYTHPQAPSFWLCFLFVGGWASARIGRRGCLTQEEEDMVLLRCQDPGQSSWEGVERKEEKQQCNTKERKKNKTDQRVQCLSEGVCACTHLYGKLLLTTAVDV